MACAGCGIPILPYCGMVIVVSTHLRMVRDGMRWDGVWFGWDGMRWDGVWFGWDGMGWDGVWFVRDGMRWDGVWFG